MLWHFYRQVDNRSVTDNKHTYGKYITNLVTTDPIRGFSMDFSRDSPKKTPLVSFGNSPELLAKFGSKLYPFQNAVQRLKILPIYLYFQKKNGIKTFLFSRITRRRQVVDLEFLSKFAGYLEMRKKNTIPENYF